MFRSGFRSADPCFSVYAHLNGMTDTRLGIAVARKAVAAAVGRNRIKRQVRESFRLHRAALPGLDVVVQAKPAAAAASNAGIRASLEWHWQELVKRCASY